PLPTRERLQSIACCVSPFHPSPHYPSEATQRNWPSRLSNARVTASPPPLWGRDRVGGIANTRGRWFPPPLAPPHVMSKTCLRHDGEGNPVAAVTRDRFIHCGSATAAANYSSTSRNEAQLPRSRLGALLAFRSHRSVRDDRFLPQSMGTKIDRRILPPIAF